MLAVVTALLARQVMAPRSSYRSHRSRPGSARAGLNSPVPQKLNSRYAWLFATRAAAHEIAAARCFAVEESAMRSFPYSCAWTGNFVDPAISCRLPTAPRRRRRRGGLSPERLPTPLAGRLRAPASNFRTARARSSRRRKATPRAASPSPASRPGVYAVVAKKASFKPATSIVSVAASGAKPLTLALQSEAALSLAVVAQRLNKARNSLSPETGGSVYRFSEQAIQDLPQGSQYCAKPSAASGARRGAGFIRPTSRPR